MDTNFQYDTQRAINPYPYPNMIANPAAIMTFSTNDPTALCLSGNAYTIKTKGDQMATGGSSTSQIKSLRINITGAIIQPFNLCLWVWTIILGSIFLFPLFFICCNWWKRKTFQTFTVDPSGYQGVAELIQFSGAQEIYLTVQDNFFNQSKAHILLEAVSRSRIQNFSFVNVAQNFDADGHNYSDFDIYMRPLIQYVKYAEISWGRKFVR